MYVAILSFTFKNIFYEPALVASAKSHEPWKAVGFERKLRQFVENSSGLTLEDPSAQYVAMILRMTGLDCGHRKRPAGSPR